MIEASEDPHVDQFDRAYHAAEARLTNGLSPASLSAAFLDWTIHFLNAPGRQAEDFRSLVKRNMTLATYAQMKMTGRDTQAPIAPQPHDHRFDAPQWQKWPFAAMAQSFLAMEKTWDDLTTQVEGVTHHHANVVNFTVRQLLDTVSPSNFPLTNPEVLEKTRQTGGANLITGAQNFVQDWQRQVLGKPPVGVEKFQVGKEVAITPGKVVYRNELIELIQYSPTTPKVGAEPILIVPAWIMKYYILDLSPHNSMAKFLVDQGHTVFMISWKNPTEADRNFGLDTYVNRGAIAALKAVRAIVPGPKVHTVGYCIGGTLLTITAALLGREGKDWLQSITLFAAQIDFTDAGELLLFIDESQVSFLEDMMSERGYLDAKKMVGAFEMLRSNDLIWSAMMHTYLLGERRPMSDLMAWDADTTRLPYRMHSEYLRELFLNNDFASGRYKLDGKIVTPGDIAAPIFMVGAEQDHVAPWHSVYKINLLTDVDVTFLLTVGGHNAGIISEPGHPHRSYRTATRKATASYMAPDEWYARTPVTEGSWWPAWEKWLTEHSGAKVAPPPMGNAKAGYVPLCDAPGTFVLVQ